jgi:hypothetical protein
LRAENVKTNSAGAMIIETPKVDNRGIEIFASQLVIGALLRVHIVEQRSFDVKRV